MPRIVLITNDSPHGQRILHTIWKRGIVLDAVLFVSGRIGAPPLMPRGGPVRRLLAWPKAFASVVRWSIRFHRRRRASYAKLCARIIGTGAMNSARMLRDLRECEPDWIILGGGGLLRPATIATARLGVLNAHPALLPWIRGSGVTGASLECGVALGATVHRVDQGIDTGAILTRRLVEVEPTDVDLGRLETLTYCVAAEMMADIVDGIVRGEGVPMGLAQTVRYPLFRWPDADGMRRHFALAATGRAHALHLAWRPLCTDLARGILPDVAFDAPKETTLAPRQPARAE